jgi:two-component system invasion response regulator UvrY
VRKSDVKSPPPPGEAILLVEPHRGLKEELSRQLAKAFPSAHVEDAEDGPSAVALCRQIHPAVVVIDVILPGIGGIETIRNLRALRADMAIIVFSIHSETPFKRRAQEAGATAFIEKTSPLADIIAAARSALSVDK